MDSKIDELYERPLNEFTAARNALAKTLSGAERQRVSRLEKPTLVPWTVNQLYWKARPVHERLMKSGEKLRAAQISTLKGRSSDVRAATSAHREALAAAVQKALALAAASGSHPGADALSRMLEALSLATERPEHPGRMTDILQPAGFEALTGVTPVAKLPAPKPSAAGGSTHPRPPSAARSKKEETRRAKEEAARTRKAEAAVKELEHALARARDAETRARKALDEAHDDVEKLEGRLTAARAQLQLH